MFINVVSPLPPPPRPRVFANGGVGERVFAAVGAGCSCHVVFYAEDWRGSHGHGMVCHVMAKCVKRRRDHIHEFILIRGVKVTITGYVGSAGTLSDDVQCIFCDCCPCGSASMCFVPVIQRTMCRVVCIHFEVLVRCRLTNLSCACARVFCLHMHECGSATICMYECMYECMYVCIYVC